MPEAKIVADTIKVVSLTLSPRAADTTKGTATIPAKAAKICCRAKMIDTPKGGTSSILYLSHPILFVFPYHFLLPLPCIFSSSILVFKKQKTPHQKIIWLGSI